MNRKTRRIKISVVYKLGNQKYLENIVIIFFIIITKITNHISLKFLKYFEIANDSGNMYKVKVYEIAFILFFTVLSYYIYI